MAQKALLRGPAAAPVPQRPTLPKLRKVAAFCRACHLWKRGTETVFGEGKTRAELFLVGEQPGDREDIEGRPFVGPAGKLLDWALEQAGIDRSRAYVTNVVKHFKWEPRGKKRGRSFRVTQSRGEILESPLAPRVIATVHPSSLLRAPDEATRRAETERFVQDLRKVAAVLRTG